VSQIKQTEIGMAHHTAITPMIWSDFGDNFIIRDYLKSDTLNNITEYRFINGRCTSVYQEAWVFACEEQPRDSALDRM